MNKILALKEKLSLLYAVTLVMIVLSFVAAFSYHVSERFFVMGKQQDIVSEQLDNDSEFRIAVENNQRITIQEIVIPVSIDVNQGSGKLQVEVVNGNGEIVGKGTQSIEDICLTKEIRIRLTDSEEIRGDFVIVLTADGFADAGYLTMHLSRTRDITNQDGLDGALYINDVKTSGYPYMSMRVTLKDNRYFPASILVTIVLVLVNVWIAIKKKYAVKICASETCRIKIVSFLMLGGYLLFELWSKCAEELCSWIGPWYVLDYGVGIGSRLFIGSIMKIFFYEDFLDKSVAYYFVMAALSVLVVLMAYMFAECISKMNQEYRKGIVFVILCYLASPGAVGYLWNDANMGRMEIYLFLLSLVAIIINLLIKNCIIRYFLLAGISCCMFAIHQGNLFTYFPVIYMLCICNVFKDGRIAWREFAGSVAVAVTSAATFLYFHFFSYVKFETLDEMARYVENRTNLENNISGLHLEYFSGLYGMFENCFLYDNYRICGIIQLVVLWPLVILGLWIGIKAFKKQRENGTKILLSPYFYMFVFNLIYIPVFTFECDWGRWFAAIITTKTIEILYLFYIKDEGVVCAVGEVGRFIKDKTLGVVLIVMYLASMEKFGSALFLDVVDKIYHWLFPFVA